MRKAIVSFFGTAWGKASAGALMVLSVLGIAAPAFAQTASTYTPTNASTDVTNFAGTTFASVAPMLLAVAGALIGIVLLVWGIRVVLHKVRGVSI